jgi:hypothetical protein
MSTYKRVFGNKNVINVYLFDRPHILKERKNIFIFDNEKRERRTGGGRLSEALRRGKGFHPFGTLSVTNVKSCSGMCGVSVLVGS